MSISLRRAAQSPLLSIVTINKNNDSGLARTIASFGSVQCNPELEFLFVDGGSADSSLELAKSFYSSDHLHSGPDQGIYAAMNKGSSLASADWILWINSGDEFLPDCWPSLKLELISSDSAMICGAAEIIHEKTGKVVSIKQSLPSDLPWFMVNHSSSVFRRSSFLHYGMYRESFSIAADRCLIVNMFLAGENIQYINLCISRFWLGGISDKRQLLRAKENLYVDLQSGLISNRAYQYALLRLYFYHRLVKPFVFLVRWSALKLGYNIPPLGKFAGIFGEPPRDVFDT
jgi:glycosyltransferase involved in cell wall biosynthesis